MLIETPSHLDNLEQLHIRSLSVTVRCSQDLIAYLSRTTNLKAFHLDIDDRDGNLACLIEAVQRVDTIERLRVNIPNIAEDEFQVMLCLIRETRHLHDLSINLDNTDTSMIYQLFDALSLSKSIVKFSAIENASDKEPYELDLDHIKSAMAKNRVLDYLYAGFGRLSNSHSSLQRFMLSFYENSRNLRMVNFFPFESLRPKKVGEIEQSMTPLFILARTLAGFKSSTRQVIPLELWHEILFQCFREDGWYEDQLMVAIRALVNRRTIGLVQSDLFMRCTKPYLYVRCRDALEKLRSISGF